MFFLEKIVDKLKLKISFFNRDNSPSSSIIQNNHGGDNVAGHKFEYHQKEPAKNWLNVICAWSISSQHQENDKIIVYEFTPTLLNKSDEIIRDLWINFSSSGFNMEVEMTKHTSLFEGWNNHNLALNMVTKGEYRYAPQNILYPFQIRIVIKKEHISNDAWFYISYGAPNVKKREIKVDVSKDEMVSFVDNSDHSTEAFLKLLNIVNMSSDITL